MVSSQLVLGALLALNVALFAPLVLAAMRARRRTRASNLADAFDGLEKALRRAAPDLPAGFTWEEAVARLRASGVKTEGIEPALRGYEDYRYGGQPLPNLDYSEVLKVAERVGGRWSLGR
ncbi:MAG TPA: hypothetical protein VLX56_06015 [Nitrososphaerales archaeon]|nr:hypothetical protein [Nitrososphaerales archaeon]